MIKEGIKRFFKKLKLTLISEYDVKRQVRYKEILEKIILSAPRFESEKCSIIIFSKDRAMQLEALLRSFYFFSKNPPKVYVLYNSSKIEFRKAYDEVSEEFTGRDIEFINEVNFRKDLISLFNKVKTTKVLFLVDDLMFKNTIDFRDFSKIDTTKYIASLRMGNHLTCSYTVQKSQRLPTFVNVKEHEGMLLWHYCKEQLDWAYPLSVDGHLFDKEEIKVLVNELDYKAPNSFEEALQLMTPLYQQRMGLCYKESIIINNPCNKVQLENNNIAGQVSTSELNERWTQGFRINFEEHKGILNESAHQELSLSFVKR